MSVSIGLPIKDGLDVFAFGGFVIGYDNQLGFPAWTMEDLTNYDADKRLPLSNGRFRKDTW